MVNLYNTNSPLNRGERQNQNRTWQDILARFAEVHRQLRFLAGGEEVDEIIQRIDDAIAQAQLDVQNSIDANDAAVANALQQVSDQLDVLSAIMQEANATIDETNVAKDNAIQAANDVVNAINNLSDLIDSYSFKGEHSMFVQYKKNNTVLFYGSTYRAKRDNLAVYPPNVLGESNDDWQLVARRGTDAATDAVQVWRGPTQPTDVSLIWFKDPDLTSGEIIQIYSGVAAPTDSNDLWLRERGN